MAMVAGKRYGIARLYLFHEADEIGDIQLRVFVKALFLGLFRIGVMQTNAVVG